MSVRPYDVIFFDLGETLVTTGRAWLPGAKEGLARLGATGLRLGLISNTGTWTRGELLARLPPDFDLVIFAAELVLFSSEEGVEKPHLEVFRRAIHRAGVPGTRCLFCTENLLDALAAQQAGMHAARLLPPPASDIGVVADRLETLTPLLE